MMNKHILRFCAAAAAAALCAAMIGVGDSVSALANLSDNVFQSKSAAHRDIQVIGIDARTIDEYGPFTEWSREKTAAIIKLLNADPENAPAVIAVDIMFASEGDAEKDNLIVDACADSDNVILAQQYVFEAEVQKQGSGYIIDPYAVQTVLRPFDALAAVTRIAHVNNILSEDGSVRSAVYKLDTSLGTTYSLGAAAAKLFAERTGCAIYEPPTEDIAFPIRFTSTPGAYYGGSSFAAVLDGEIPTSRFRGDIVFIGAFSSGMMDSYITPIDHSEPMFGVEIHANIADSMLKNRFFNDVPELVQRAAVFVIVLAAGWLILESKVLRASIVLAATLGAFAVGTVLAAKRGVRFDIICLPLVLLTVYLLHIIFGFVAEYRTRMATVRAFKQYVSPDVVDTILDTGGADALSGSAHRDIAVMFLDVRGFTSLSEKMDPGEVVEVLNEYFSVITQVAFRNGGTIDKFIGDGVMIIFGAPLPLEDYVYTAVRTGLEIISELGDVSARMRERFGRDVMVGIGVNCGNSFVGSVGTQYRMDYTAIGDTVNTAARLEQRAQAATLIISQGVLDRLQGRITVESVGSLQLKGKEQALPCYSVTGLVPGAEKPSAQADADILMVGGAK